MARKRGQYIRAVAKLQTILINFVLKPKGWVSNRWLAERSGYSTRHVSRMLADLQRQGWLDIDLCHRETVDPNNPQAGRKWRTFRILRKRADIKGFGKPQFPDPENQDRPPERFRTILGKINLFVMDRFIKADIERDRQRKPWTSMQQFAYTEARRKYAVSRGWRAPDPADLDST